METSSQQDSMQQILSIADAILAGQMPQDVSTPMSSSEESLASISRISADHTGTDAEHGSTLLRDLMTRDWPSPDVSRKAATPSNSEGIDIQECWNYIKIIVICSEEHQENCKRYIDRMEWCESNFQGAWPIYASSNTPTAAQEDSKASGKPA